MKAWGRRPGVGALLICLILSVALLAAGGRVRTSTASFLATTILRPFEVALTLGPRLSLLWMENRALHRVLETSAWDRSRLRQTERENHRLRNLLEMTRSAPESLVVSSIIARDQTPHGEVLFLDKGSLHGIAPGAPVASLARLVGVVDAVEPARSRVLTLWNLELRVSGRVGPSGPGGILRWEPGSGQDLLLENIPIEDEIVVGDTVWTSGLGEVFPAGMAIGSVRSAEPDSLSLVQTVRVHPFVSPARLQDILIVMPGEASPADSEPAPQPEETRSRPESPAGSARASRAASETPSQPEETRSRTAPASPAATTPSPQPQGLGSRSEPPAESSPRSAQESPPRSVPVSTPAKSTVPSSQSTPDSAAASPPQPTPDSAAGSPSQSTPDSAAAPPSQSTPASGAESSPDSAAASPPDSASGSP